SDTALFRRRSPSCARPAGRARSPPPGGSRSLAEAISDRCDTVDRFSVAAGGREPGQSPTTTITNEPGTLPRRPPLAFALAAAAGAGSGVAAERESRCVPGARGMVRAVGWVGVVPTHLNLP